MINLIPNKEKKEMVRDFYLRLGILFLAMTAASLIIAAVAMLPAYFLSSVKNKFASARLEAQANEPVPLPDQQTLAVITDLDNKLSVVEKSGERFVVSERVISAVILRKTPQIKITDFSYQNDPVSDPAQKISIQGTAPSREILLSFRKALEDDANFKSVDLPISNFVKGSDIQFYLSLIPSK